MLLFVVNSTSPGLKLAALLTKEAVLLFVVIDVSLVVKEVREGVSAVFSVLRPAMFSLVVTVVLLISKGVFSTITSTELLVNAAVFSLVVKRSDGSISLVAKLVCKSVGFVVKPVSFISITLKSV